MLFASVLCGRVVARMWPVIGGARRGRTLAIGLAVVAAAMSAGLGYQLSTPRPPNRDADLVAWLEAHHFDNGVGDYWSSSLTTVTSDDRITVRPVTAAGGRIAPLGTYSARQWYSHPFQFLVYQGSGWLSVDERTATATFGSPAHVYAVDNYRILVWREPIGFATEPAW